jgi:hypothetical protein
MRYLSDRIIAEKNDYFLPFSLRRACQEPGPIPDRWLSSPARLLCIRSICEDSKPAGGCHLSFQLRLLDNHSSGNTSNLLLGIVCHHEQPGPGPNPMGNIDYKSSHEWWQRDKRTAEANEIEEEKDSPALIRKYLDLADMMFQPHKRYNKELEKPVPTRPPKAA